MRRYGAGGDDRRQHGDPIVWPRSAAPSGGGLDGRSKGARHARPAGRVAARVADSLAGENHG